MSNLKEIEFKNFITLQRRFDLPSRLRVEGDYPIVASTTINGFHKEYKVLPPGVVTGRSGSLGEVQYINQKFWPLNTALWVKDFKGNLPKYVYFFLKTLDLQRFNSGAGVPTLNRNDLDSLEIKVHNYPTQQKIAGILSAYDDLIENNTRRIEILEEMARMLYREWFVKFRFPGHQAVHFVESELGLIPEDWEVVKLPSICSKVIDGTHDSPKPALEGYYLITGKHINNGFINFAEAYFITSEEHEKVMKRSKPEKGDTIFSNIGTLGNASLIDQDFEFSIKNLALFKPLKKVYSNFIYLHFSSPEILESMEKQASGTSQRFFSLKFLRDFNLVKPSENLLSKFDNLVEPIIKKRSLLNKKNINLHKTRDLLLPRLISGEIDVENLAINTGIQP